MLMKDSQDFPLHGQLRSLKPVLPMRKSLIFTDGEQQVLGPPGLNTYTMKDPIRLLTLHLMPLSSHIQHLVRRHFRGHILMLP